MKKKIWIIIGIVGIILFTSGGILLLKSNHKEKEPDLPVVEQKPGEEKPPVEEIKEEPISLELAENLYQIVYGNLFCGMVYRDYYQYDLVTPDTLSNETKNEIVIQNLNLNKDKLQVGEEKNGNPVFLLEDILKMKNQILGEDTSFELNIGHSCMEKFEELEEGKYFFETHCGGICTPVMSTKFSKTVKIKDKIILEQLVTFNRNGEHLSEDEYTNYYYQDYKHTILLGQKKFKDGMDYFENAHLIDWNYYQDKAGQYRFTYQINDDGTYTFLQMERIK